MDWGETPTTTAGMHACVNAMESTARGMAARSFAGASSDRLRVTILDLDGWKWEGGRGGDAAVAIRCHSGGL